MLKHFFSFSPRPYIEPGNNLRGKIVLITRASKGIGASTAQLLYKKGASLALISRSATPITDLPEDERVLYVASDVSDPKSSRDSVEKAFKKFGKIDCLVNNAGLFSNNSIEETSLEDFKTTMNVNLVGMFNMTKAVIPHMKRQKNGLIICIGSKISHNTNVSPNKVTYATTKYAVEGFSFAANKELKPFGIRVSCLMPGTVATFMSRKSGQHLSPYEVANLIKFVIENDDIDFESVVFKSRKQNI